MGNDWGEVSLGDVAELLTGFPFESASYTDDPKAPRLLRGDNVAQGRIRWDDARRWPASQTDGLQDYWLKRGDVILAMDRPWIDAGLKRAKIQDSDLPALLVQRVARLRGGPKLDTGFLGYVISGRTFTEHVLAVQTGTAVPHISPSQIRGFRFALPPLAEQRAIASILGVLDDKIELNRRMNETLEGIARALFDQRFGDADANATIGELADIERESTNPQDHAEEWFDHYSLPAFDEDRRPARERGADIKSNKFVVAPGCVLISKLNPSIPRVWFPRVQSDRRSIASTEFLVLRPTKASSAEYLNCLFRSEPVREHLIGLASGTSNSHQRVKPADLLATVVHRPSTRDLASFTNAARPLFALFNANLAASATLAETRDTLLPRLLSGELRVGDPRKFHGRVGAP